MAGDLVERLARRALTRANRGRSLSEAEAAALLSVDGDRQTELFAIAARLRDLGLAELGRPGVVTYSPKVFVPLTRLCRDRCHYCAFAATPGELRSGGQDMFLGLDEVLTLARAGADAGCAEALFTLGDRPESRWPAAERWLAGNGYATTVEYVRDAASLVLEQTGLLPHLNPGVLDWDELAYLRPVAASMGLMLESSSERLCVVPGMAHFGSPDKHPEARLRTLSHAGRQGIPFTTGVLVGIGETDRELIRSLIDIRSVSLEFEHIQEVIVQNFRAKPRTAMRGTADADCERHLNAVAVARVLLGPTMAIQAPPNLVDVESLSRHLEAGASDWGGVGVITPDHVNPERPWPSVDRLRSVTEQAGLELRPRLSVYPPFVMEAGPWLPPAVAPAVHRLSDPRGLLASAAMPASPNTAEVAGYPPDPPKPDLTWRSRTEGAAAQAAVSRILGPRQNRARTAWFVGGSGRMSAEVKAGLRVAESAPHRLAELRSEDLAVALMAADGPGLRELSAIADGIRRDRVGDEVTFIVNRNINFTNVCYTGCGFCSFARRRDDPGAMTLSPTQIAERVAEAVAVGATEICMQGGIDPRLSGRAYFDLIDIVKAAAPGIHLHAFSPMEIHVAAARSGMTASSWLAAAQSRGLDSIPGTAAEILDDDVRALLTKGKLPVASWIAVIETAHALGIPSSATMMYGHVDEPAHWVRHLRTIRQIQERTRGFTEFVGLPFIHRNTPLYLTGRARPGPTARDDEAVTAMARLMLAGAVDNIQVSWVKLGVDRCAELLNAGANDVGGTLMEESITVSAGGVHGHAMDVAGLRRIAAAAGRPTAQRDTLYRRMSTSATHTFLGGDVSLSDHT